MASSAFRSRSWVVAAVAWKACKSRNVYCGALRETRPTSDLVLQPRRKVLWLVKCIFFEGLVPLVEAPGLPLQDTCDTCVYLVPGALHAISYLGNLY